MAANGNIASQVEVKRNQNMVNEFRVFTKHSIDKKVKDSNRIKVGAEGHLRTVAVEGVHTRYFKELFSVTEINTLDDAAAQFGSDVLTNYNRSKDVCVIVPWVELTVDLDDSEFIKGKLLIPLRCQGEDMECFVPCGSAEELSNGSFAPPSWASDVPITSILPGLDIGKVKVLHEQPEWAAYGKLGEDDVQIGEKGLEEGWLLVAMNKIYRVVAVGPMFSNHKETPYTARLDRPLENNLIRRKVSYVIPPTLYGCIKTFQMNTLKKHQNIEVSLKAGVGKIGTLRVVHKNAVFNSSGYLVHDTHV
jgi:hypothetical protein